MVFALELLQIYSSAMLSDNLQGTVTFDEFLEGANSTEKVSWKKEIK